MFIVIVSLCVMTETAGVDTTRVPSMETKAQVKAKAGNSCANWDMFAPARGGVLAENLFEVKPSTIEGAGQGVFTKIDIPKGVHVMEYQGIWKKSSVVHDPNAHNNHQYCFEWTPRCCLDATSKRHGGKGRYVNDTHGTKLRANLTWNTCKKKKKVYMTSTRKIRRGSELFIPYGGDYWEYHDLKLQRRKRRAARSNEEQCLETEQVIPTTVETEIVPNTDDATGDVMMTQGE